MVRTGQDAYVSWFVGYRGDLAFTILIANDSPGISASVLAGQFLNALRNH